MLRRRDFLKTASLGAAYTLMKTKGEKISPPPARAEHPNILVVISDQYRAGFSLRSGYQLDTSPTLDRLALEGVSFDRAYATQPVCVPSRTSLLTGRWPHAHRVRQNSGLAHAYFEKDLLDVVKPLGYKTGLSGKNHTYLKPDKFDFWREYDDLKGWLPSNPPKEITEFETWRRRLNFACALEPTPFPLEAQFTYRVVSSAIEFLEKFASEPFFLEVSFPEPHDPEQVPRPYWDMFPPSQVPERCAGPEALKKKGFQWKWMRELQEHYYPDYDRRWRRYVSNYLGSMRMVDDQLSRLLNYMESRGLLENTLIVCVSDHGDYVMDYGLMRKGVGLPDALVRIPMVWSGWGTQGRHPHHQAFVSMADVMPTLCEAVGAEIPRGVQGRSLWPLLQDKEYPQDEFRSIYAEVGYGGLYYDESDHPPFQIAQFRGIEPYMVPEQNATFDELNAVTQSGYMKMVRMGDWKLMYDMMGYGQMYNMVADPCELKNLFGESSLATEQLQLMEELLMWTIRTQDTLPTGAYKTKWPSDHNWYAPLRRGISPQGFVP
jgi:arylsulfatase A-like enzyme